jgi:hypothetical protein
MAAIPALSKTYSSRGNNPFADVSSTLNLGRSAVFNFIQHLKNTASGGATSGTRNAASEWVCKGSCDGVSSFNTSGTDLIASRTNLVWAAAASTHSWWWGENTALGYQIAIECITGSADGLSIAVCPIATPMTGGSLIARPQNSAAEFLWSTTSTGQASVTFLGDTVTGGSNFSHFACADDGQFIFFLSRAGTTRAYTFVALLKTTGAGAGDTRNVFLMGHSSGSSRGAPEYLTTTNASSGLVGRNPNGVVVHTGGLVGARAGGTDIYGASGVVTDAVTGKHNIRAAAVASVGVGNGSERGILPDIYFCPPVTIGTSIPSAAAQTRVVLGDFIVPFPGVVPTM